MATLFKNLPPNETRGPELNATAWTGTSLAVVMVALRLYTRVKHKNMGWDDYTIVISLGLCIWGSAMITMAVQNGFGKHLSYIPLTQIPQALKWSILAEMSAYFATFFIKVSVCFFVFRLIRGSQEVKGITRILYALMAFMTIVCFVCVMTLAFECIPFSDIWNLFGPNRRCLPDYVQPLMVKIYGGTGAVTDIACVACPVYVVRKLQMKRRLKLTVAFLIGLGLFTAVCSIAKAVTASLFTLDSTWDLVPPAIWQLLEQNLGIVVASAPAIRQLFNRRKKSRSAQSSSTKKSPGKKYFWDILSKGSSSGKATQVSNQTVTSDGNTLIPMVDLEAGNPQEETEDASANDCDTDPQPSTHDGQHDSWDSIRLLLRRGDDAGITRSPPVRPLSKAPQSSGPQSPATSPTRDRTGVSTNFSRPTQPSSHDGIHEPQSGGLVSSPKQEIDGRRGSDDMISEPGIALPLSSDYISLWEGLGSRALNTPQFPPEAQASNIGRLRDPVFAAVEERVRALNPDPRLPDIVVQEPPDLPGRLNFANLSDYQLSRPEYRLATSSHLLQPGDEGRNPVGNKNKPLPALPIHSRSNQYQQRWM